eukprot:gene12525-15307_t
MHVAWRVFCLMGLLTRFVRRWFENQFGSPYKENHSSNDGSGLLFHSTGDVATENSVRIDPMSSAISVSNLHKTYDSGFEALKNINLDIHHGEIFALLGPNGAGKTTLISTICGIVNPTSGTILADGHDIQKEYRAARTKIGLVPQELTTDAFETVWNTVSFSRGLFGKPSKPSHVEKILKDLSKARTDALAGQEAAAPAFAGRAFGRTRHSGQVRARTGRQRERADLQLRCA